MRNHITVSFLSRFFSAYMCVPLVYRLRGKEGLQNSHYCENSKLANMNFSASDLLKYSRQENVGILLYWQFFIICSFVNKKV